MKKQLFTYWEGPRPPYIGHCMSTIRKNAGVDVFELHPGNVEEYMGDVLHSNWKRLTQIAQKVDCIRLAVMYENGGLWCDADTLFLDSCADLFRSDVDFIGMRWTHNWHMQNGYWFCKKGSKFVKACLGDVNKTITKDFQEYYESGSGCHFGEDLFARIEERGRFEIDTLPVDTFIPVNFPFNVHVWNRLGDIEDWISEKTVAIALNNSHMGEQVKVERVERLAMKRNLLGSALRYTGVGVTLPPTPSPNEDMFKKYRLPVDFCEDHPEWKIASKRNRFKMMMEELEFGEKKEKKMSDLAAGGAQDAVKVLRSLSPSKRNREMAALTFDGKLAIITAVSGEYQWFAPMFVDRIRRHVPDAEPIVLVRGKRHLPSALTEHGIYDYSDFLPMTGENTASLRFLIKPEGLIDDYDFVLITDVDIMFFQESESIVNQHVRRLLLWGTQCYDNYVVRDGDNCRMPGVHFVTNEWWDRTAEARRDLMNEVKQPVEKGHDEDMLYRLIGEARLPRPSEEQNLSAHHGLHLGAYRQFIGRSAGYNHVSAFEQNAARDMMSDNAFMELVDYCSNGFPLISDLFKVLGTMLTG